MGHGEPSSSDLCPLGSRVGLWASIEAFVTLLRPTVTLDDGTLVFRMPEGGGGASVGFSVFLGG